MKDLDGELHSDLVYLYGKALVEHGGDVAMWRKGEAALTEFASGAGRDSKHDLPAPQLLLDVEVKLDATARPARLEERLPEILRMVDGQMVRVPGGSFAMRCTPEQKDCDADEEPVHRVQIRDFDIGRYEVSQDIRESVTGANPSALSDCPKCPVETVSWDDSQASFARLNAAGGRCRLPTEAEWEYAARDGPLRQWHPCAGSGDWASVAWYYKNSDSRT